MNNYLNQYKNTNWQRKRLEILQQNKFKCQVCENSENELHIHHLYYQKDRKIWDYDNESLLCLCNECHEFVHSENFKKIIGLISVTVIKHRFDFTEIDSILKEII